MVLDRSNGSVKPEAIRPKTVPVYRYYIENGMPAQGTYVVYTEDVLYQAKFCRNVPEPLGLSWEISDLVSCGTVFFFERAV